MESDRVLDIETEYREGILFARLSGKLESRSISFFKQKILEWKEDGFTDIVFNLHNLEEIDREGINTFFEAYQMIHDKSGHSLICGMNHHINQSLKQSKILNYIYEISDELNAIKVMKWNN